jgi:hypothetical protein
MRPLCLALLISLSGALAAVGQPLPPKEVSPLFIYPVTNPPVIVRSFPAEGQALTAGVLVLNVTFDQAMVRTGFDFSAGPGGEAPPCLRTPRLLEDQRTFVLLCTTLPGKAYAISFNANPEGGFTNTAERRATAATLTFSTTDETGATTVRQALRAAGLRDGDVPIQEDPNLRRTP